MNKTLLFSTVIATMILLGCSKEGAGGSSGSKDVELVPVEFEATHASVQLKSSVEGESIVWTAGDSLSVFDGYGYRIFKTELGGAKATFKGQAAETDCYYAVYPAGAACAYAEGRFSAVIPAEQCAETNSSFAQGANVSVGVVKPTNGKLGTEMKNIASYIKIRIEDGNRTINRVSITSSGVLPISGSVIVRADEAGNTQTAYIGSSREVSLVAAEGRLAINPGEYLLAVNPVAVNGKLTVRFESKLLPTVTKEVTVSESETIKALSQGKALSIGTFNPIEDVLTMTGGAETLDSASDPVGKYGLDYSKLNAKHPRLMLSQEEFLVLMDKVSRPEEFPMLQRLHQNAIEYADDNLKSGPAKIGDITDAEDKTVALSGARSAVVQLFSRAYAYRMTRDEKYLNAAVETMNYLNSLPNWGPKSYLTTGEASFAMAVAYDWLYYDLPLDVRKASSKSLIEKGIATAAAGKLPYGARSNWNQVTNGGIVSASIATYDINKNAAFGRIEACIPSNIAAQKEIYSPDGNNSEGYGYWSYGTNYQLILNESMLSAFGADAGLMGVKGFDQTADFILFMHGPCGDFAFADGGRGKGGALTAPWWFAVRYDRPDLAVEELRLLNKNGSFDDRLCELIPVVMSKFPDMPATGKTPSHKLWTGGGITSISLVRDGWNNDETDFYVGLKGGMPDSPHGHMDNGTFVYDAYGCRWADDILRENIYSYYDKMLAQDGIGGHNYFSFAQNSNRWDVLESCNIMHNCLVLYNNDGSIKKIHPTDFDVTANVVISEKFDTDAKRGAKMDMTSLYKGQAAKVMRSAVLADRDHLEIIDEVTALPGQDAEMEWRMVTIAETIKDFDCIELTQSKKSVFLSTSNDGDVPFEYQLWPAARPADWPVRLWNVVNQKYRLAGFKATVPAGKTVTFTTVIKNTRPDNNSQSGDNEKPEL